MRVFLYHFPAFPFFYFLQSARQEFPHTRSPSLRIVLTPRQSDPITTQKNGVSASIWLAQMESRVVDFSGEVKIGKVKAGVQRERLQRRRRRKIKKMKKKRKKTGHFESQNKQRNEICCSHEASRIVFTWAAFAVMMKWT